ncbi:putative methyltransferase DDB_G0268948 isoform X3 [Ascaphus truei]|uniref:putative methyltransferase DDB_G0268948 isoform X3 n=1 Tax=Ascaphus truei TaxID=8439 RepID=UPI003F593337
MALIFSDTEYSAHYQKYMLPASEKMVQMMLSYLITKKGKPFELAVDVGCGTGRYTRPVAAHFEKVIGIDISESQINEARRSTSEDNVLYHTSPAEELPVKDASVDLVFAGLAAHWFIIDKFMQEAARVLKPGGCLALHAFIPIFEIQYQDVSETLTAIITETINVLLKYRDKSNDIMKNQYRELFEAVPFADKQRITDIPVMYQCSLADVLGFIQSIYMYQEFLKQDRDGATEFLQRVEKRFRDTLGESSHQVTLEFHMTCYCVLACKS